MERSHLQTKNIVENPTDLPLFISSKSVEHQTDRQNSYPFLIM
jgi:hypothetical protein